MGLSSRFGAVLAIACLVAVQACGMGSGNTPPFSHPNHQGPHTGPTGPVVGSSDIILPYYIKQITEKGGPYRTTAFIPVNPKDPTKSGLHNIDDITSNDQLLIPRADLRIGEYNDSEFKVHNYRQTGMLYTKSGRFWMADFTAGGTMRPMRVSSETEADLICDSFVAYHYPDQHHTVYLYLKPVKKDKNDVFSCDEFSTLRWYAIRMDDPEDRAPRALPEGVVHIVSQLYNLKNNAELRGFLVEMDGRLRTLGADFILKDGSSYNIAPVFFNDGTTEVTLDGAFSVSRQNMTPEKLYWLKINDGFYLFNAETNRLLADSTANDVFKLGVNEIWITQYSERELLVLVSDKTFDTEELQKLGQSPTYVKIYRFLNTDGYAKSSIPPIVQTTGMIGDTRVVPGGFLYVEGAWKSPAAKLKFVKWTSGVPEVRDIYSLPTSGGEHVFYGLHVSGNRLYIESKNTQTLEDTLQHADISQTELQWTTVKSGDKYPASVDPAKNKEIPTYGHYVVSLVHGHVYDPVFDQSDLKYVVVQEPQEIKLTDGRLWKQNKLFVLDAATGSLVRTLGWIKLGKSPFFETRGVARQNFDIRARDDGLLEVGVYNEASFAVNKFDNTSIYYFDASKEDSLTEVAEFEGGLIKCGFTNTFPYIGFNSDLGRYESRTRFNNKEQCE